MRRRMVLAVDGAIGRPGETQFNVRRCDKNRVQDRRHERRYSTKGDRTGGGRAGRAIVTVGHHGAGRSGRVGLQDARGAGRHCGDEGKNHGDPAEKPLHDVTNIPEASRAA